MKRIGIFCGGFSSEFDISIASAKTILASIPKIYDAFLIVVRRGDWRVVYKGEECPLDLNDVTFTYKGEKLDLDYGLVYIHGNPGENGKIQAFLEMKQIPCINSGALASELSFDKWFCNQFLRGFNVNVAKSVLLHAHKIVPVEQIVEKLGLPVFVKPSDSGSSFGITKVKSLVELPKAIDAAFQEGKTVVVESNLSGTEVTCAAYRGDGGVKALPVTEIVAEGEFFDYQAKYEGKSQEITPARISEGMTKKVQDLTISIYKILRLRSVARVDFMIVKNIPHVIEVNTTPGFSSASLVPQMIKVQGITNEDFWSEIIAIETA
ncbi:ATP-grasp domain-containing protein [Crocinitomicaceae bacterium]|nr:ATP-grasp domain-containing protein [Crocinitomicaceae bacterium]